MNIPPGFYLDSDCGRIGPLIWINSDTTPRPMDIGAGIIKPTVRWGTISSTKEIRVHWQVIDD